MFAQPNQNDFLDWIRWHLDQSAERARWTVRSIKHDHSAKGLLRSGATIKRICDEVFAEFDLGIQSALGEVKRSIRITNIDPQILRQLTIQCLNQFLIEMKEACEPNFLRGVGKSAAVDKMIDESLSKFDSRLRFVVRQFDVGFLSPGEPEQAPMAKNFISIGTMTGSSIQQDSAGAKLANTVEINVQEALAAIESFEASLKKIALERQVAGDMAADIATIKAQLSKQAPSIKILHETAKSLRNIAEQIVAGVLTSESVQALAAFGVAIGLR